MYDQFIRFIVLHWRFGIHLTNLSHTLIDKVGDFLYLSVMKDLSKYIESLLEEIKIDADYKVWYEEGTYMIKIRLKGITYINDTTEKHIRFVIGNALHTYFPKGGIKYDIKLTYYLA